MGVGLTPVPGHPGSKSQEMRGNKGEAQEALAPPPRQPVHIDTPPQPPRCTQGKWDPPLVAERLGQMAVPALSVS